MLDSHNILFLRLSHSLPLLVFTLYHHDHVDDVAASSYLSNELWPFN